MTEKEFTAAAERHLDMVYRVALNCLRNQADAEDAAQNAMLRLYRTDTAFQGEEHLRYWLVRVTINECKRISSSFWRTRTVSLETCSPPIFSSRERETIYQEVMSLPAKYRVPLYLYYYEDYSVDEIARAMSLKPSTVQTRLARARDRLKTILTEE